MSKKWIRSKEQSSCAVVGEQQQQDNANHNMNPTENNAQQQQPALRKAGKHKLVLAPSTTTTRSHFISTTKNYLKRQKKETATNDNVVVVKRIQLSNATEPTNRMNEPKTETNIVASTARLTDFAYRCLPTKSVNTAAATSSTSKMTSYHRVKPETTASQNSTGSSRALVRVKPGEDPLQCQKNTNLNSKKFVRDQQQQGPKPSSINICSAILSGFECSDIHCTKRHDIPKKNATPICTFFQRMQCQKGDTCPFLHIKVNPQAEICSRFQNDGYCSAGDACPQKHIRIQKPRIVKNNRTR